MTTQPPATQTHGWIPHDGGECPLPPGTKFEYRLRDGGTGAPLTTPTAWYWKHDGGPYDIVAYRIASAEIDRIAAVHKAELAWLEIMYPGKVNYVASSPAETQFSAMEAALRCERERIAGWLDCTERCRYVNASGVCQRTDELCSHHVAESIRAGEAP